MVHYIFRLLDSSSPWNSFQLLAPGLSHIRRRKVTSPNGNARWRKVTSHGGKSHHFVTIPMAQRHPTENQKVTKSSRDIAHSEIFVDFRKKFAPNTNVPYSLFPNSQHPGSQWHSDYYTDFSWQSFLTIPMAQRLLHRLLLAIFPPERYDLNRPLVVGDREMWWMTCKKVTSCAFSDAEIQVTMISSI